MTQTRAYYLARRARINEELRVKRLLASDPKLVVSEMGKVYRWVWHV